MTREGGRGGEEEGRERDPAFRNRIYATSFSMNITRK